MQCGHKMVLAKKDTAIREYAESLIIPLGAVELVVASCGFRRRVGALHLAGSTIVLENRTVVSGRLFPWPICTWEAFDAEWWARCAPLKLARPVIPGS